VTATTATEIVIATIAPRFSTNLACAGGRSTVALQLSAVSNYTEHLLPLGAGLI